MEAKNADLSALRIDRENETTEANKSRRMTWLVSILTIVALAVAGYFALGNAFSQAVEVSLVTVAMTSPSQSNAVLTASGYVVAQRKASVASKATGRLVFLGVVEGDKVKKDQEIARLEDTDIMASLEQARANLKLNEAEFTDAKRTLERQKSLLAKELSMQADYDAAEMRYNKTLASIAVAKAIVSGAEVALENTRIRAPFDGTVLTKSADVGEMVVPMAASVGSRAAVVTIADMTSLQVEADVSESNIERITPTQPCEITLDAYPDKRYEGYVAKIVPTADRAKATVMVKVAFKEYDARVLPEMSAKVLFLSKASDPTTLNLKPILTVPASAIVSRNSKDVAFVVVDNRAIETTVKLGRTLGSYVEITSGLTSGQKVIDKADDKVKDGIKVKVQ